MAIRFARLAGNAYTTRHTPMNLKALVLGLVASALILRAEVEIPAEHRVGGFALGCQAYTFHRFTAFEAIEKTAAAGGKVIEFYPGQALSPEERTVKLDHNAPEAVIQKVKDKLKKHGLLAVNYGVVGLPNNEAECRKVFDFAKKMGMRAVTSEAKADAMDLIEKLVKEYDIAMGIHNHPKRPNDPNYKHWDPNYILSLVKDRDRRIGACADTGHFARSGIKPVDALKILEGRLISLHLKDLHEFSARGHDVPFGTGQSDIAATLQELKRQNFQGNISIEYEYNLEHSLPEVAQCVGFVRGFAAQR
ncbi:MAG TPA: sugar phosphate isomerase/epimerase [Methylomirabilota bacterium]|nr:sugar phosphate isomerase/epimerase [Methylomirabilota bacterium]